MVVAESSYRPKPSQPLVELFSKLKGVKLDLTRPVD